MKISLGGSSWRITEPDKPCQVYRLSPIQGLGPGEESSYFDEELRTIPWFLTTDSTIKRIITILEYSICVTYTKDR